jgi:hypothetical protein
MKYKTATIDNVQKINNCSCHKKYKGKAIPVTGREGP